ncbi:MAG: hypothetical protein OEM79_06080 [Nitrosopumilus sp.]|nr:hypothetical protein [Nitrosopumilus sp.]
MDLESSELWENTLISVIKKEMGLPAVKIVKDRLLEKYGTTIRQSAPKWEQIEDILFENFGEGSNIINRKLLQEISKTSLKTNYIINSDLKNDQIKLIGDPEVSAMLNQVLKDSKIIKDIIKDSKVSQTTAYRKIEKMKEAGLLVNSGFIISPTKKKIVKYTSPFESLTVELKNGKSLIKYGPKKKL